MEPISKRTCPWLTEEQISLLQSNEIRTFIDFIASERNAVMSAAGLKPPEYESTMQKICDCIRPTPITATQLVHKADEPLFPTGIQKLDKILSGGLDGGEILEIYGKYRTGKTQMCLAIAAQFCHFQKDKLSVVYFDLKNDFRATRFLSYCQGVEKDLNNIQIIRPSSFHELISDIDELYEEVSTRASAFYSKLKLVIFDSTPMVIYPTVNEDPISWRFHEEQFIEKVTRMAQLNSGIVIILVNHAVTNRSNWNSKASAGGPSGTQSSGAVSSKPAMGTYWLHKPNFRLQVSEHLDNPAMFNATLEKSTRTQTIKTFDFSITESGIVSY